MDGNLRSAEGLRKLLDKVVQSTGIPGISVTVCIDGSAVSCAANHPATRLQPVSTKSRFEIACIGKLLLSVAVCDAIASGEIDPDAPISKYLPELAGAANGDVIRIWNLLTHTSGYEGCNLSDGALSQSGSWEDFVAFVAAAPRIFPPGTTFSYDSSEHVIAAEILRRLRGRPPAQVVQDDVLGDMGLAFGSADQDDPTGDDSYVAGHSFSPDSRRYERVERSSLGSVWRSSVSDLTMTTHDLAQAAAMAAGREGSDGRKRKASTEATNLLLAQQIAVPRSPDPMQLMAWPVSQGMGFAGYADGSLGHNGSTNGQCCAIRFDPRSGAAVAVGINANAMQVRDTVMAVLIRALNPASPTMAVMPVPPPLFSRGELAGTYVGGIQGVSSTVSVNGDLALCRTAICSSEGNLVSQFDAMFSLTAEGAAYPVPASRPYPVWFFREQPTGAPCLMMGSQAYRRARA